MRGIRKAVDIAADGDQKRFAKKTGIDRYMLNKMVNGHVNPVPKDFKKICECAGLPPEAIATAEEVDYGILPVTSPTKKRAGDRHKKKATVRFRVLPRQHKQIDKDRKLLGYPTMQSWGDECVKRLHAEAEAKRGRR